jgi:hypothetical protein
MEMILSQIVLTSNFTIDIPTILQIICLLSDALPNDHSDMSVQISPLPHSSYGIHRSKAQRFCFILQKHFQISVQTPTVFTEI